MLLGGESGGDEKKERKKKFDRGAGVMMAPGPNIGCHLFSQY